MTRFSIASIFLLVVSLACAVSPVVSTPTVTPKPTQEEILALRAPTPQTAIVTADSLHVRAEPMGLRIGYLYNADAVALTGLCRDGWAEIVWQDGTGWVNADYLSDNKCKK
jgi:hypothetical protein